MAIFFFDRNDAEWILVYLGMSRETLRLYSDDSFWDIYEKTKREKNFKSDKGFQKYANSVRDIYYQPSI